MILGLRLEELTRPKNIGMVNLHAEYLLPFEISNKTQLQL